MGVFLSAAKLKGLKGVRKLSFLTCYDYQTALWMDRTRLDGVLVGDSLSQVLYGLEYTSEVSMDTIVAHTVAVRKGLQTIHLIADMPYVPGSQKQDEIACTSEVLKEVLDRLHRFKEIGVDSIKIENPCSEVVEMVQREGISVCGHVGLTPQTIHDFKKQGIDPDSAKKIFDNAQRLDKIGCYALVLEAIPDELADRITQSVSCLTISIASGQKCDAQILVHYDLLGLTYSPKKFVRPQASWGESLLESVEKYIKEIENSSNLR